MPSDRHVRAPAGFAPNPCPICDHMPERQVTHETLGGFMKCVSVRVACTYPKCPRQPATRIFGLPVSHADAAEKVEKLALFEWNEVIAAVPVAERAEALPLPN